MGEEPRAVAIVLAAGSGTRIGSDRPKALLEVGGVPIVALATAAAVASRAETVIVTAPAGLEEAVRSLVGSDALVIAGGPSRQDSVRAALAAVPDGVDVVVVHDAARPFASPSLFDAVIGAVIAGGERGGAIPVIPVPDTVKRVDDALVTGTEPREGLVLAQTPQAFGIAALRDAHARAAESDRSFTDDAAVLEWAGYRVCTVAGEPDNFKITSPADLARAEAFLERSRG
jgi:2-C-methyl-D-erythritol 4-phosphate cytidylyltransferase